MKRKKLNGILAAAGLGATMVLGMPNASAGGFDGSSNLVCAAINVVACTDGPTCLQGQARTFELPEFMAVDFKKKVIRATDESGHKQVSPIKNMQTSGSQLILQGIENGHGWSMNIDKKSGKVATTVSGEEVSFMVFGACTTI